MKHLSINYINSSKIKPVMNKWLVFIVTFSTNWQNKTVDQLSTGTFSSNEEEFSKRMRRQTQRNGSDFSLAESSTSCLGTDWVNWADQLDSSILNSDSAMGDDSINQMSHGDEEKGRVFRIMHTQHHLGHINNQFCGHSLCEYLEKCVCFGNI